MTTLSSAVTTQSYLQSLSFHWLVCLTVNDDLYASIEMALAIPVEEIRDSALKEVIVLSNKAMAQDNEEVSQEVVDLWNIACSRIGNRRTQLKTAYKIVRSIGELICWQSMDDGGALTLEEYRAQTVNKELLKQISKLIKQDQHELAFQLALTIERPADSLNAFCQIAGNFPSDFQWPAFEQAKIEYKKASLLESLENIGFLQPAEIDQLLTRCKELIIDAASYGMPHIVLEIADAVIRQHVQFSKIEKGLQRAVTIISVYNADCAAEILKKMSIPIRQRESVNDLEKIAVLCI
ncbi:MAG TPA: hypothetical protein VIJ14_02700 [Rhabdochlamydiaceae bacterium]